MTILIERDNIDVEFCYIVINEFGCLPSDMFDCDVIFIIVYCVFLSFRGTAFCVSLLHSLV